MNDSQEYIPLQEFASSKGLAEEKVIAMIRDGFYSGRKQGDDWFVHSSELSKESETTENENSEAKERLRKLAVMMIITCLIGFILLLIFFGQAGHFGWGFLPAMIIAGVGPFFLAATVIVLIMLAFKK